MKAMFDIFMCLCQENGKTMKMSLYERKEILTITSALSLRLNRPSFFYALKHNRQ